MKLAKKVNWALSTALLLTALSGCTDSENTTTSSKDADKAIYTGTEVKETVNPIEKEGLESKVDLTIKDAPVQGEGSLIILKNKTSEKLKLTMNNGQNFDYKIYNDKNKVVYTWSEGKAFTEEVVEKVLKPNETLDMNLELLEALKTLPAGDYEIEAYSTAKELKGLKVTLSDYHWIGNLTPEQINSTDKETVQEATVEFVGWADNHTIEVIGKKGEHYALQVTEVAKLELKGVKEGEAIVIYYVEKDKSKELRIIKRITQ
jgi:hypothetical protein